MAETARIEGHLQWNGSAWSFYTTHQPQLRCFDQDHAICARKSEEMQRLLEQERERAEAARQEEDLKAERLKQTTAQEQERREIEQAAWILKNEQCVSLGAEWEQTVQNHGRDEARQLEQLKANYDKAVDEVKNFHKKVLATTLEDIEKRRAKIEATDWVARARARKNG